MIYTRGEGDVIRNGFNFYPKGDTGSKGFIFKLFSLHVVNRYSYKLRKRLVYKYTWSNKDQAHSDAVIASWFAEG